MLVRVQALLEPAGLLAGTRGRDHQLSLAQALAVDDVRRAARCDGTDRVLRLGGMMDPRHDRDVQRRVQRPGHLVPDLDAAEGQADHQRRAELDLQAAAQSPAGVRAVVELKEDRLRSRDNLQHAVDGPREIGDRQHHIRVGDLGQ